MRLTALALLVGTGCAHTGLVIPWADETTLTYDPARYPDDAAVVLHRADHQLMVLDVDNYSQVGRHEVFALQGEGGFDLAEVKVAFFAKSRLIEIRARMKHPGGAWEELDPKSLLSDTSGTGERDVNAKFFRFPRIQVGSLLEYVWIIERDGISWGDDSESVGKYPVRRYLFDLEASKQMVTTVTTYNTNLPIRSEVLPNKHNKLTLEIRDIPARPAEDYTPDWSFTEPRWAWRMMAFDWGRTTMPAWHTWDQRLESRGGNLFGLSGDLFDGYKPPTLPACADVGCKIAAARTWLRQNLPNKIDESSKLSCRPMKEVLEAGRATGQERAVLLRRLLADAGLQTRLAFATRHWSSQMDPNFPSLSSFNEMLVYLPAQPGLLTGAWLAPRCDHCGVNELPSELRGVDVLLFNATRLGLQGVAVKSEWKSTGDADPALAHLHRVKHEARLDDAGTLTSTIDEVLKGPISQDELKKHATQTDSDVRREEKSELGRASALARLLDLRPRTCSAETGVCEKGKRVEIPAYATAESSTRWLVPLNALSASYAARLIKDQAQRVADLHLVREENFEEIFEVEARPGFVLESAPPPVQVSTTLVVISVKVEPTAKGARVTRTLKRSIGGVARAQYAEVQNAYRAFQDARHLVLSFVKK